MKILDKELIYLFLFSIFNYIYKKILVFLIINLPDSYLKYNNKSIPYILYNDFSDSDSDSEDEINTTNTYKKTSIEDLETFNKFLKEWEYEIILKLFNIPDVELNIITDIDKQRIPILFNLNSLNGLEKNNIVNNTTDTLSFSEAFLFNISLNKKNLNSFNVLNKNNKYNINIKDIYSLKNKISLIYSLNNKLLSNTLRSIFPEYKYLYILYKINTKNNNSQYKYILVDLHNNYDLIKKKSILFNLIKL